MSAVIDFILGKTPAFPEEHTTSDPAPAENPVEKSTKPDDPPANPPDGTITKGENEDMDETFDEVVAGLKEHGKRGAIEFNSDGTLAKKPATKPAEPKKIEPKVTAEEKAEAEAAMVIREAIARIRTEEVAHKLIADAQKEENKLYHMTRIGKKWYSDTELPKAEADYEKLTGEKPVRAEIGWYRRDAEGKLLVSKPATDDEVAIFLAAQRRKGD